jgi:hypothetical protein
VSVKKTLPLFLARPLPLAGAVLLFGAALFTGCQKPEDDLGLGVLDPNDALETGVIDTTRILAWTVEAEPVRTSALSRNVLGSYLDPDFGLVHCSIVTQVRLSGNNVGQGDTVANLVCDSLVLGLVYDAQAYGYGARDAQSFRVFRLNEDLSTDSTYDADHVPAILPEDLVSTPRPNFAIDPYSRPYINGDSLNPQLRIPLQRDLGQELLNLWGGDTVANNDAFVPYFKGLMITPGEEASTPLQQAALYFNLLSADTKLTLYYHHVVTLDTRSFDFIINTSCVRYTAARFAHSHALQPGLPAALADSTLGQQTFYVQALGGTRGELRFPSLDQYVNTDLRSLAKAELVMPLANTYYPLYEPPTQLFLFRKDDDGNVPDLSQIYLVNQQASTYDPIAREYRFIITAWAQKVINGDLPNTGLSVFPGGGSVSVNRVSLAGPEHPTVPMKLRLTFTTY